MQCEVLDRQARGDGTSHRGQGTVRERPADPPLPVARADDGQVDGEEDRGEAGVERLGDQLGR